MTMKVVLAYSGGLDTSVAIPWLKETYGAQVITLTVDLGGGSGRGDVRERALASGAVEALVVDGQTDFVRHFVFPALQAGAIYQGQYHLATALGRPLIARHLLNVAHKFGAEIVAHGCTGKGNDQVRFELTYKYFAPHLPIIAPWREWSIKSREEAIEYARQHNIPVTASVEKIYSRDRNLWHISHEGGVLEDPAQPAPDDVWQISQSPRQAPEAGATVRITFEHGDAVAVDGKKLGPVEIIDTLNRIGARHGIGRIDLVENRYVGMKSRGAYETPGGTLIILAHRELEALCLDRDTNLYKQHIALDYASIVYNGTWYTPLRGALDAFVNYTQRNVTGEVALKLYRGNVQPGGATSPCSLFSAEIASFTMGESYNQKDAEGFINLIGLPIRVRASLEAKLAAQKK